MKLSSMTESATQFEIQSFSVRKDPPSLFSVGLLMYDDGGHWTERWYPPSPYYIDRARGWWEGIRSEPGRKHIILYNWMKKYGKMEPD